MKFPRSIWIGLIVAQWLVPVISMTVSAQEPLRDVIDQHLASAWRANQITPPQTSTDAEFLRRVYLDLVGTIPSHDEALAFLNDSTKDKRAKLVDRLLDDPRFASHQSEAWDLVLFGRNPPGFGTEKRDAFQGWLRQQFADNRPYDQWANAILRGEGNSVDDGPPMFLVQYKNQPEDAAEAITQKFLGVQLQCARCHDHPFESWSQLDFYGFAAFFARLSVVEVGKKNGLAMYVIGEKNTGDVLFTGPVTEQEVGKKGEPVKPKFLHGEALQEPDPPKAAEDRAFPSGKMPPPPKFSRKDTLADWITDSKNPYFARAVANRVWAQFLGRGLVHPVDNMSESNKPSHPELLDALSKAMIAQGFDLKWYIRELVNSQAYQVSGAGAVADAAPVWFERARSRPLSAEELRDAWTVAVGYDAVEKSSGKKPSGDRYAPLTSGYLIKFFGSPNNGVGDFQGGLHEHLYLNNGGMSSVMITSPGSLHHGLLKSSEPWAERVDRLYLSVLSRRPEPEERAKFVAYLSEESDPSTRLTEAIWVLMTCSEFRFNH